MELRVIRDDLQHAALLEEAKDLALMDPPAGSSEAERLAVISVLLEKYEAEQFRIDAPDPVDAINYRLAELGLKQKDLADMLGSKSRASEILNRKRELTVDMIRIIHDALKIPAEILIGHSGESLHEDEAADWSKFPVREMKRRGWFDMDLAEGKSGEQLVRSFFARTSAQRAPVFLRKSFSGAVSKESQYAVYAWVARVLIRARDVKRPGVRYVHGSLNDEFLKQVAKLSRSSEGPLLAREFLAMKGITLVIEPHLPKTKLDGAALLDDDGSPIVGLTLRYNRVDYFWFTLMHELVHVQRHLGRQSSAFIDEEQVVGSDEREAEADIFAAEAFIPRQVWKSSEAYRTKRSEAVVKLADSLMIHPAIVAGRIQKEARKYNILKDFGASQDIRSMFGLGTGVHDE